MLAAGYKSVAPHMMSGLDGMAFDQFTDIGKFWSAAVAALTLLMVVDAERNRGVSASAGPQKNSRAGAFGSARP